VLPLRFPATPSPKNAFSDRVEFLKEHKTVQDQAATIARQQKQIEALSAGLQKVNAQLAAASPSSGGLEASKSAPQVAKNNQ
jgi:hypothetical protein